MKSHLRTSSLIALSLLTLLLITACWPPEDVKLDSPEITQLNQPDSFVFGEACTLSADVDGEELTYEWVKNDTLTIATTLELVISNLSIADNGSYVLKITNSSGSVTTAAIIILVEEPIIITPDKPTITISGTGELSEGSAYTINATTSGTHPVTITWHKDDIELAAQTDDSLVFSSLAISDLAKYYAVATNSVGTDTSNSIILSFDNSAPVFISSPIDTIVNEGASLSLFIEATDSDNTPINFTLDGEPSWVTSSEAGDSFQIIASPTQVIANAQQPKKEFSFRVIIADSENGSLSDTQTVSLTVKNVNQIPTIDQFSDGTVGSGNTYTSGQLRISDADGDELKVIPMNGLSYDTTTQRLSWYADPTSSNVVVGQSNAFSVKVTDYIDTVDMWFNLAIVPHQWKRLLDNSDSIIGITAIDAQNVFILEAPIGTSQELHKVNETGFIEKTISVGSENVAIGHMTDINSFNNTLVLSHYRYTVGTSRPPIYTGYTFSAQTLEQDSSYADKPYIAFVRENPSQFAAIHQGSYPWKPMGSPQTVWSTEYYLYDSEQDTLADEETYVTLDSYPGAHDIAAAREGYNIFVCNAAGGILLKRWATDSWSSYNPESKKYVTVEPASEDGEIVYFIDEEGTVSRSERGTNNLSDLAVAADAPLDAVQIQAMTDKKLWILDEYGALHFSAKGFVNDAGITESVDSKKVIHIVVSEDRKELFAITEDNDLYRY